MKKHFLTIIIAAASLIPVAPTQAFDLTRIISAGAKAYQAITISDANMASYISQYVSDLDKKNNPLPASNAYSIRLAKITKGLNKVDGIPLNFKVYKTTDVNAFACADGSVRVYSGLMDIMTDDEVLGVIGHEIGHVAHHDTRKAFQQALLTSALADGIASRGGLTAILTDSQLGQLGQAMLSAKYSRKQESQADDYGYNFLKKNGKNPWAMAMAFERLKKLEGSSSKGAAMVNRLFSDHPDLDKRIKAMSQKATKDGYSRPSSTK